MRDDEVLNALDANIMTALVSPEALGVGRILASTGGDDFLSRDVEGQLPAVGIASVDLERAEQLGVNQKRFKGKVGYEISVAASAEGDGTMAGRDQVRQIFGLVNKALDFYGNQFGFRFTFIGLSIVPHPSSSAVIGVARFETFAFFGNE